MLAHCRNKAAKSARLPTLEDHVIEPVSRVSHSSSNFRKAFPRWMGKSPGTYREQDRGARGPTRTQLAETQYVSPKPYSNSGS